MKVASNNPDRRSLEEDDVLFRRQQLLIRTLRAQPQLGKFVKSLTWTHRTWSDGPGEDDCLKEGPTWAAFKTLSNIEKLDFCSMVSRREIHAPPPLFSSAKWISIGGQMSHALATSILHSVDPSKITYLELDNLQDLGQLRKHKAIPLDQDLGQLRETTYPDRSPKVRHPGAMRDHLRFLEGRCTALRTLVMRSVGQDYYRDWLWSAVHDEKRYSEWARFIDSTRSSLQGLQLEQGLTQEDLNQHGCVSHFLQISPQTGGRPMDRRFIEIILPVLLKRPWPKLRALDIRGIGGRVQNCHRRGCSGEVVSDIESAEFRLKEALGPRISVSWEPEASRTFFIRLWASLYYDS